MELEESLVDVMLTLHLVQCLLRVAVTVKAGTMNGGLGSSEVVLDANRVIGNDSHHWISRYPLLS